MNRNFYDILIAKVCGVPYISDYVLTLEAVDLDSYANGVIDVSGFEYKTYNIRVNNQYSWSASAVTKNAATIFVGWYRDRDGLQPFSPNAAISGSINRASITLYALFKSNVTKRTFCYSTNPSDLCTICNPVDVYFNTADLNTYGYTGVKWYSDNSLTTLSDSGYYRISSGNQSSPIYHITTDSINENQFVSLVGTCGSTGPQGPGVSTCQNPNGSIKFNLIQNNSLNAVILDVDSSSSTHAGIGVAGQSYSFDVVINANSGYTFGSTSDISIVTPGYFKTNGFLSNSNTVMNFTISVPAYPVLPGVYDIEFGGTGAQVSPVPGPTSCIQYRAATYSSVAQTVTYVDCNGYDAFFSIGGTGGYDEVDFCAYEITNYPAGVGFSNLGSCAGSIAHTTCECWDFLALNVTSAGTFTFTDCDGNSNVINVEVGDFVPVEDYCIEHNSWGGTASYSIVLKGNCCNATPITTCTTWTVYNTSTINSHTVTWEPCDGIQDTVTLSPGQSYEICAFYEDDIIRSSGAVSLTRGGQCSTATPDPEPPSESYSVSLSYTYCRIEGSCNDNSTCGVRFLISTTNAPAGSYVDAEVTSSSGASVTTYTEGGNIYLNYTETNGFSWAYVNLYLKNSSGSTLATSLNNYITHGSYWSYLSLCSGSTPVDLVYDVMYVQSSDGTSSGYVQFDANYSGYTSPVSTTISDKCYYITSTSTSSIEPTNTITGTCTISTPPQSYYDLYLGYDLSDPFYACQNAAIYANQVLVFGNNVLFDSCTGLYDSGDGSVTAAIGWYSDGYDARYWNGSGFTVTIGCGNIN